MKSSCSQLPPMNLLRTIINRYIIPLQHTPPKSILISVIDSEMGSKIVLGMWWCFGWLSDSRTSISYSRSSFEVRVYCQLFVAIEIVSEHYSDDFGIQVVDIFFLISGHVHIDLSSVCVLLSFILKSDDGDVSRLEAGPTRPRPRGPRRPRGVRGSPPSRVCRGRGQACLVPRHRHGA